MRLGFKSRGLLDSFFIVLRRLLLGQTAQGKFPGAPGKVECCQRRWTQLITHSSLVYLPGVRIQPVFIIFQNPMLDRSKKGLEKL